MILKQGFERFPQCEFIISVLDKLLLVILSHFGWRVSWFKFL